MAHEAPLHVNQSDSSRTKTRKHKPIHHSKMQLPNGKKPDFGQLRESGKDKQKQKKKPQLPNGVKPNFGAEAKQAPSESSAGKKPKRPVNKKGRSDEADAGGNKLKGQESYAGSSFHSSPEAIALPKPSFAKSPEGADAVNTQYQLPAQNAQLKIENISPAFIYQGMPPNAPPSHPVTLYPPSNRPGFDYYPTPQGYINYLYPPTAIAQPPLPMQSYPFQVYPPVPPPAPPQLHGQRITFNELMSSSKEVHP